MESVFRKAVDSYGRDYVDAESRLRSDPGTSISVLRANRNHSDPIVALMVRCLDLWMQNRAPDFQRALTYLEQQPEEVAETPLSEPPAIGVANELSVRFGPRAAELLALRLVKEIDWPDWKVFAVLMHLEQQRLPSTTSAVIRFAAQTRDQEARSYGIGVIRAIDDPDLGAKLAYEQRRFQALNEPFPEDLATLAP